MERPSEHLDREADQARAQLAGTLDELRARITPGVVVDQVLDYAREGPAADFFRNLGREARDNPLPLVLIGIGIAWLMVASSRSSRALIGNTADTAARKAAEVGAAASALVSRTSDWGQQTAAQLLDRVSDVTTRLADRTGKVTGAVAEKASTPIAQRVEESHTVSVREPEAAFACAVTPERVNRQEPAPQSVPSIADDAHWQHDRAVQPVYEDR
jgi:hypothetical protein